MSIDKSIDYVEQDGYKNYTKNSDSVTVPRKFKARKNAPSTKLAYITDAEEKQLKKQNPGTPHKGPSNVPSYDSFDAQGNFTSGAAMSAMESGSTNARDRAEVQASNYGAPSGAGPGVKTQAEQDLRAATIAAGAGQRVNPGFFDSRDTVSPAELAAARAINPDAFRATRGGGLSSFFTGGGLLGNIIRAIGNRFGLGKKYNEPTYDMSQFNNLGLLTGRVNPTFQNDLDNEGLLSLINEENDFNRMFDTNTIANLIDKRRRLEGLNTFKNPPSKEITDYQNFLTKSPDFVSFDEYQRNKNLASKGIMQDFSEEDLDEIGFTPSGKEVGYVGYDPAESMDIAIGRKIPQLGDLTGFIDPLATMTARERELKDLFSSNTRSDIAPQFQDMVGQVGLSKKQKQVLNRPDVRFSITDPTGSEQEKAIDSLLNMGSGFENLGDPNDPATKQDIKKFYGIDV